jgi:hypothetical protein
MFAVILLCLSGTARAGNSATQPAAPTTRSAGYDRDLTISVEAPATIACGEKNVVIAAVHNGGKSALICGRAPIKGFVIQAQQIIGLNDEVIDVTPTKYYESYLASGIADEHGNFRIGSGKTIRVALNLSELLDFSRPGQYSIAVSWEAYDEASGKRVKVKADAVTVDAELADIPVQSEDKSDDKEFPTLTTKLGD